jgi:hemin uptake protein HemP
MDVKSRLSNTRQAETMNETEDEKDDREDESPEPPRVLNAEEIFAGRREVWIELDGVRYRLRITRRGKLILQK